MREPRRAIEQVMAESGRGRRMLVTVLSIWWERFIRISSSGRAGGGYFLRLRCKALLLVAACDRGRGVLGAASAGPCAGKQQARGTGA